MSGTTLEVVSEPEYTYISEGTENGSENSDENITKYELAYSTINGKKVCFFVDGYKESIRKYLMRRI